MAVRRTIPEYDGTYFITITCARWLHLFEIANGYDVVYQFAVVGLLDHQPNATLIFVISMISPALAFDQQPFSKRIYPHACFS